VVNPNTDTNATPFDPVADAMAKAKAAAAKLAQDKKKKQDEESTKPVARAYNGADLAVTFKPPTYILRPIIPRGRLILLVGDSNAGKTPFLYQLIGNLLKQKDFLKYFKNETEEPLRIGMIDAESTSEDIGWRKQRQGSEWPESFPVERFVWTDRETTPVLKLDINDNVKKIQKFVEDNRLDLVILDNLHALSAGANIAKPEVASKIITGLNAILHLPWKPSLLFVHHPRKKPGGEKYKTSILDPDFMSWIQELSGTMVWINRTDVRLGIARIEKNGNEYTVLRGMHRVPGSEQQFGPIYLSIDDDHDVAKISNSPDVLDNLSKKIREIAEQMKKAQRFTRADSIKQPIRCFASKKTVGRAIKLLKAHGFLNETSSGEYRWQDLQDDDDAAVSSTAAFDSAFPDEHEMIIKDERELYSSRK